MRTKANLKDEHPKDICECGYEKRDHCLGYNKGEFCLKEIKKQNGLWVVCPCKQFKLKLKFFEGKK